MQDCRSSLAERIRYRRGDMTLTTRATCANQLFLHVKIYLFFDPTSRNDIVRCVQSFFHSPTIHPIRSGWAHPPRCPMPRPIVSGNRPLEGNSLPCTGGAPCSTVLSIYNTESESISVRVSHSSQLALVWAVPGARRLWLHDVHSYPPALAGRPNHGTCHSHEVLRLALARSPMEVVTS
jgi:hypothetical protein